MASQFLEFLDNIDRGRRSIIEVLNQKGSTLPSDASLNNISNEIRSRAFKDVEVRDPYLTTYYDNPLEEDPSLPKPPKMFLDYVEMFRELDPITDENNNVYYPAAMTLIGTQLDEVVFSVDSYPNGSAKKNGLRIGQYGNKIVSTSDGSQYLFTQSTEQFTHTWDKTKDLYDEETGLNYRYIITFDKNTGTNSLKTDNVEVLGFVYSMRRGAFGTSYGLYSNVKWGYIFEKCTKDTHATGSGMYMPSCRSVQEWLYIEKLPEDITLHSFSTSDNMSHINAEVAIINIEHTSLLNFCRIYYTVKYLEIPAIAINMLCYSSSSNKKPQLKYLNIRDKKLQETSFKGTWTTIYPPLLKDPYLSTLITEIDGSNLFSFGTNVKTFSLPNIVLIKNKNAFSSGIFETLDLSNFSESPLTSTTVQNLDVSGIKNLTSSLGVSAGVNYVNLSGAETITGGSAPTTVREIDISSAIECPANYFQNCKNLRKVKLKDDFSFSLNFQYADTMDKECILEIFNKAKTFNVDDEEYQTNTITLNHAIKSLFSQRELNTILNKGWKIVWYS